MHKPEIFAVIDLGTNSLRLLIASRKGEKINILFDGGEVTKLGANLKVDGTITTEALNHNIDALQRAGEDCTRHHAAQVVLVGTSAVREAGNRDSVLQSIKNQTGFDLHILTGIQEAYYTYHGGLFELDHVDYPPVLMDSGGGSTEFIWSGDDKTLNMISEPMGALRFTDECIAHDPPEKNDIQRLESKIKDILDGLPSLAGKSIVGVGGTITTLAAVILQLPVYDPNIIHGQILTAESINDMFHQFISLTVKEKINLPGMEPRRADIITAGTAIVLHTMIYCGFKRIVVSDRGLRFGVIQELTGMIPPPP